MSRLVLPLPSSRAQRGTVARGLLVLGVLVGAVVLQTSPPSWQSRLDAVAASLGMPSRACHQPSTTAGRERPAGAAAVAARAPQAAAPSTVGVMPHDLPALAARVGAPGASVASGLTIDDAAHGGNRSGGAGLAAPAGLSAPAI